MIHTMRDAENEIRALKVEIEYIKKQIRIANGSNGQNKTEEPEATPQIRVVEIDSDLSAGGSQVIHQLFHIFNKIKANIFEAKEIVAEKITALLEIITPKLKIKGISYPTGFWSWEEKEDLPHRELHLKTPLNIDAVYFYEDGTGSKSVLFGSGVYPNASGVYDLGHGGGKWNNCIFTNVSAFSYITEEGGVYKAWDGGIIYDGKNLSLNVVTGVSATSANLQYKDWAGNNQSLNVLTSLPVSNKSIVFKKGIMVST